MKLRVVFVGLSLLLMLGVATLAGGGIDSVARPIFRLVGVFGQVVALVRSSWVEEIEVDRLEMGAVTGLIEAADPGGSWVPEQHAAAYAATCERLVPAFGVVLGKRASYPVALQVLAGSAAAEAGLKPGELLEKIAGEAVRARPLWLARVLLERAERAGEVVELDVIDRSLEEKREIALAPGGQVALVAGVTEHEGVPVVRLSAVDATVGAQLEAHLFPHARAEVIVVDARGLAIGSVEGAAAVAATLAGGKVLLRIANRDGEQVHVEAEGPRRTWRVLVCTDNTTAGAGESMVVALQQLGATLVGSETYGDTGLRGPAEVAGGQLWIAERWSLAPDGSAVLGRGVKPDEAVRARRGVDAVLERALELARGEREDKAA